VIRVKDLEDQTEMTRTRPFLLCRGCGAHWSGNRGDYFMAAPNITMRCHCDGRTKAGKYIPLMLVDMERHYHTIKR
jgi:hypothetical protein